MHDSEWNMAVHVPCEKYKEGYFWFKTSKIDFKILKVAAAAYCLPQWSLNICFPPVEEGGWARIPCYDGGRHSSQNYIYSPKILFNLSDVGEGVFAWWCLGCSGW